MICYYKFRHFITNSSVISKSKIPLQNPGLQIPGYCYKIWYIIKNSEILFKSLWYYYISRNIITNSEALLQIPGLLFQIPGHYHKPPDRFLLESFLFTTHHTKHSAKNNPISPRGVVKQSNKQTYWQWQCTRDSLPVARITQSRQCGSDYIILIPT